MAVKIMKAGEFDTKGFTELTGDLVKLDVGEAVVGRLSQIDKVNGENGQYPIYTFRDKDEGTFKIAGASQIEQAMRNVAVGDLVYIERLDDGQTRNGQAFHQFSVKAKRAGR